MDFNRFNSNIQATKKVINKGMDHVMLSTLGNLDDTYAEGQGILGDLSSMSGALQEKTTYVEQAIIARAKANDKVVTALEKVEDLQRTHDAEMQDQLAKAQDEEIAFDESQEEYSEARSQYDEAEHDLSYWEGQAIQVVNNLNNQISALVSGAEALGIDISVDKYITLRNKLEDDMNHERIDWINDNF